MKSLSFSLGFIQASLGVYTASISRSTLLFPPSRYSVNTCNWSIVGGRVVGSDFNFIH